MGQLLLRSYRKRSSIPLPRVLFTCPRMTGRRFRRLFPRGTPRHSPLVRPLKANPTLLLLETA